MEDQRLLYSLLERSGQYHPLYGGGLATHLPMVLTALDLLKAPNKKLQSTFDNSLEGLEKIGCLANATPVNNIESYLGNRNSFRAYLQFFTLKLQQQSTLAVLKETLPRLISGVAASAFHALIRLAYAIEANCQSEIATALAYWCAEYQPFELNEKISNESAENILARLAPYGEKHQFLPGIIVDRMSEIGTLLKHNNSVIQPSIMNMTTLRELTITLFYLHENFTLLHTVTGCHALSIILPYFDDQQIAIKEFWKAIVVAYLSTGIGYQQQEVHIEDANIDFSPIIKGALLSDDSHIIKLIYTCVSEYKRCKNPLYYNVSLRALSRNHS